MDTSDPDIEFDDRGQCTYCRQFDEYAKAYPFDTEKGKEQLERIVQEIKDKGKGKEFDSIIGLSGGADSSYAAYKAVELGLRPLAIHVDDGWNSEESVNNIKNLVKNLNLALYTFTVDREEMRDLLLAFFKSSVANCAIPQDHVVMAVSYHTAYNRNIKYIISGSNLVTESILPKAWGHNPDDLRHMKAIHKRFGTIKIRKFPTVGFFRKNIYYPYIVGIKIIPILDYLTYKKSEAINILVKELGWRNYGRKHCESIFTRFFQEYYLPRKFGFDKRRAHLSSLIVSGQMTRDQALRELGKDLYLEDELIKDKELFLKKFNITEEEFENMASAPNKTFRDYPSNHKLYRAKERIAQLIR
jgi:N-acetyl sugar amidotransferase